MPQLHAVACSKLYFIALTRFHDLFVVISLSSLPHRAVNSMESALLSCVSPPVASKAELIVLKSLPFFVRSLKHHLAENPEVILIDVPSS